jgi:excinuclease ABC subunit C
VPYKNGYRRFKIKKTFNQNDFSMMEEIIIRRYHRTNEYHQQQQQQKNGMDKDTTSNKNKNKIIMAEEVDSVTKELADELPNLIIIDGGKGHLNIALKALKKIGLEKLECVSLAKENEEIFISFSNDPIIIPKNKKSLKILQHIRDESHRFGLAYNRKLRKIIMK